MRKSNISVLIITNMPSYHQVDLFNKIAEFKDINLEVMYLREITPGRQWKKIRKIKHSHKFIREIKIHKHFYFNPGLIKEVNKIKPNIIIITQYASIGMQLIMYYASIKKIPFIFWSEKPGVKYSELPIFNSIILRTLFRRIALYPIRWAVDIWGIGERAKTYFSNYFKKDCRNMPYFFNQDNFINIKRNYKIDCIKFLFAGKFNYRKGVDILISAINDLLKQRNDFVVNFVGDGPFKKDVINLANKYPNNVKYLGFKEIDEIPSVMAENDVLICPSRYDGWGMVVVEAMAAGMPVISCIKTGSAIDIIENERNGYIVEFNSQKLIVKLVLKIIHNKNIIKKMSINARKDSFAYSAKNGAKLIVHSIENILG